MRGQILSYNGVAVIPTYYPLYVLKNGSHRSEMVSQVKKDVWDDIGEVIQMLELS